MWVNVNYLLTNYFIIFHYINFWWGFCCLAVSSEVGKHWHKEPRTKCLDKEYHQLRVCLQSPSVTAWFEVVALLHLHPVKARRLSVLKTGRHVTVMVRSLRRQNRSQLLSNCNCNIWGRWPELRSRLSRLSSSGNLWKYFVTVEPHGGSRNASRVSSRTSVKWLLIRLQSLNHKWMDGGIIGCTN